MDSWVSGRRGLNTVIPERVEVGWGPPAQCLCWFWVRSGGARPDVSCLPTVG